jgi:hypothetical protein
MLPWPGALEGVASGNPKDRGQFSLYTSVSDEQEPGNCEAAGSVPAPGKGLTQKENLGERQNLGESQHRGKLNWRLEE